MILDVLMQKIREGHVPSIRVMQDRMETVAPSAPRAPKQTKPADHAADETKNLGKKEQKLLDAQRKPDDWGDIDQRRRQ
ncbi:MAG: hypothetical protein AAF801_12855 [Pseudomonadota bacterium]